MYFLPENDTYGLVIILGSVLVEIIGRSHLKKRDWLASLFHFNLLSPSQSNYHCVVYCYAFLKNTFNPFMRASVT